MGFAPLNMKALACFENLKSRRNLFYTQWNLPPRDIGYSKSNRPLCRDFGILNPNSKF